MLEKCKDAKLFTIVVCTYNGEKTIERCLDALIRLEKINDYVDKIMVVDNNSTDATSEIIHRYCKKNEIIRYIFEPRQGLAYAREQAINASTDWVIYVDDDNILDTKWLIELKKIVSRDENLGIVNGAVIAVPEKELNREQEAVLRAMYKNLACTHCEEPGLNDAPSKVPMGAGMCVRKDALNIIEKEGWLNLKGRTGQKLSSGEDTELCERVFDQGYGYQSNFDMKLYHIIPLSRLQEQYVIKLIDGLVEGRTEFIKTRKFGYIQCRLRKIKYLILKQYIKEKMKRNVDSLNQYWKYKVEYLQAIAYLRYI